MQRRPTPADASSPLPSLDDVRTSAPGATPPAASPARRAMSLGLAAGVAAAAGGVMASAEEPVCGSTRAEELAAHSTRAGQSLRRGDLTQTLREMGLALGWMHHTGSAGSPPGPEIHAPGEMSRVTPRQPEIAVAGAAIEVAPTPPNAVGGPVRVEQPAPHATPPTTPRPPARGGRGRAAPLPREHRLGDVSQVSLEPPDDSRRG